MPAGNGAHPLAEDQSHASPASANAAAPASPIWFARSQTSVLDGSPACASATAPASLIRLPSRVRKKQVAGSACANNAGCVTDGPGNYGNVERCTVRAAVDLFATATQWEVYWSGRSDGIDFYIPCATAPSPYSCRDDVAWYAGARQPDNVPMRAGDTLVWRTNHRDVREEAGDEHGQ